MDEQSVTLDIFYSYACRDTYEVFEWLRRAQAGGAELDITWHPFAIQMGDDADYWRRPWDEASSELRGFIAAEATRRQGEDAFRRFHAALEQAVHEHFLELAEEETLVRAAEQADLSLEHFWEALQAPAELARVARRSHERAETEFDVFGTPTLVFPDGQSRQGVHLELETIPPESDARPLWEIITASATQLPYVEQFTRTTPVPL